MKRCKNKILFSLKKIRTDGRCVIISTAVVLLAGMLSRLLSVSPIYMLRITGLWHKIPPTWFFVLLWTVWYGILGFCFGMVIGSSQMGRDLNKYKGSLWFVLMMVFNIIWYPLFFKAGTFFLALIDLAIIIFFCFCAAVEYFKFFKIIGIVFFIHLFWLIWCFCINFTVFLRI